MSERKRPIRLLLAVALLVVVIVAIVLALLPAGSPNNSGAGTTLTPSHESVTDVESSTGTPEPTATDTPEPSRTPALQLTGEVQTAVPVTTALLRPSASPTAVSGPPIGSDASDTPTPQPSETPRLALTGGEPSDTPVPTLTSTRVAEILPDFTNEPSETPQLALTGDPGHDGDESETPTPPPTFTLTRVAEISPESTIEPTAAPQVVAAVPVQILSASGQAIGVGTLRLFHEGQVSPGQTTRVELVLNIDTRYITPTPFGPITPVPVVTATPGVGTPTATPRVSQQEASGLLVYQRMGASLFCSDAAFEGCDREPDPRTARLIGLDGETWSWILSAREGVEGLQDLRVQVWTVNQVNGQEQADFVEPRFDLRIEVSTPKDPARILIAALGIGAVLVLALWVFVLRRPKRKPRSTVFISYRRSVAWSVARTIHDRLVAAGADVFLDVDDINEGRFEEIIKDNILNRDYFLLIIAPGTLESEWVIREATYALENNKRIIPVLVDGARLYDADLPPALRAISSHNAITLTPEFFEAGLERIMVFIGVK